METKLIAAELATAVGCHTVITLGSVPTRILEIVQSHNHQQKEDPSASDETSLPGVEFAPADEHSPAPHTLFTPKPTPLSSRRFWILHGLTPRGTVYIDYGAYLAISRGERDGGGGGNGGRLLAAGVLRVEGNFAAGQAVRVCVIRNRRGRRSSQSREEGARKEKRERAKSPDHWQDRQEGRIEGEEPRSLSQSIESLDIHQVPTEEDDKEEEEEEEDVFEFGRGLTNYNSVEIDRVKGLRSYVLLSLLRISRQNNE